MARRDDEITTTETDPGMVLVRRLLPSVVSALFALAWLTVAVSRLLGRDTAFAVFFLVVSSVAIVVILVLWSARSLSRVDAARTRAEEGLRAVTRTANDGIVSADHLGTITYFNPGAERLFGYAAAEAVGQPLTLLMPERLHEAHREGLARYVSTGDARVVGRTVELVGRRTDGHEFPVEVSLASWSTGGELFFTGILRDVSERHRVEAELRTRTAQLESTTGRLEALVRAGLALTSPVTLDRILQEVVESATRLVDGRSAVLRLTGEGGRLEIRAAHGMSAEYVAQSHADLSQSPVADVMTARRAVVIEDVERRPDLVLQALLLREGVRALTAVPLARSDQVFGILTVHKAVPYRFSEEELAALMLLAEQTAIAIDHERLFRESEARGARLADQARELDAFTYTVSHDLKAPLRGMDGYARALIEDYGDRLDDEGRRYLGAIQRSARRMGELIDDLLRYSRLERRQVTREEVPLRPLLERLCEEVDGEIQARKLSVRLALAVEGVRAEREGLREALANLIGNAVKFSPEAGGTITIESRREGDDVVLSVADSGIGFDMKYHDRIFRIFERLHRPEDYPGTGVGLAIVRKVAERHGGRAWAESEPGKGSTFFLAVPAGTGGGA